MKPKISIVVPVYNVERYLERCLKSVLSQSFDDYEVVLVDDGSTDDSGNICDIYAKSYNNFKVIHKENKGLSHTRNIGVDYSNGEFIYFLDSDDYIIPDCLKILYENLLNTKADISCGSFGFFEDKHPLNVEYEVNNKHSIYSSEDACIKLLYGKRFYTSSCNILIKTEIAKKNHFPLGKYHEDEMTTFRYFLEAKKIVMNGAKTYYYYQREGSIMHSFGQPVLDEIIAGDNYVNECKNRGLSNRFLRAALCKKYYLYLHTIENYPELKEKESEIYYQVTDYLQNNYVSILFDVKVPISIKKKTIKYIFKSRYLGK